MIMEADSGEMTDQHKKLFKRWLCPNTFSCKICNNYSIKRRDTFTTHLTRIHRTGIKEYETKYEKLIETRHQCKECQREVLHDKLYLTGHFSNIHQGVMTIEQYFLKHIIYDMPELEESNEEEDNIIDSEQNEFEMWAQLKRFKCHLCKTKCRNEFRRKKRRSYKSEHLLYKHIETAHNMEPETYYKMVQKNNETASAIKSCKACEYQGASLGMVVYHAVKVHNLSPAQYMSKYEPDEDRHQCKLCRKTLNKQKLTRHFELKDCHRPRITLKQYYERFIKNNPTSKKSATLPQMDTDTSRDDSENDGKIDSGQEKGDLEAKMTFKQRQAFRQWSRPVTYKCKICPTFTSKKRRAFFNHLAYYHNTRWAKYKKKFGRIFDAKHTCQLCRTTILQEEESLKGHLRNYHEGMMSPGAYFLNYIHESKMIKATQELNDADREQLGQWLWPILYKCQVCSSYSTKIRSSMLRHISSEHKMGFKEYDNKFGHQSQQHCCRLCNRTIIQEEENIKHHFKSDHCGAVSVEEYFMRFIKAQNKDARKVPSESGGEDVILDQARLMEAFKWSDQCHYACKICDNYSAPKRKMVVQHIKKMHRLSGVDNIVATENYHKCHRCGSLIKHMKFGLIDHLQRCSKDPISLGDYYNTFIHGTDKKEEKKRSVEAIEQVALQKSFYEWAQKCTWMCPICGFTTQNGGSFTKHLHSTHSTSLKGLKETEDIGTSQMMSKSEMHDCKICAKSILHDSLFIKQHMTISHGLTGCQYYEKFFLNDNEQSEDVLGPKKDIELNRQLHNWAKAVSFVCQICQHKASELKALKLHLFNTHKIAKSDYDKIYKNINVTHQCRLCSKKVPHRRSEIKRHLHQDHKDLSIDKYFKDFILGDLELRQSHFLEDIELVELENVNLGISNNYEKWLQQLPISCQLCKKESQDFYRIKQFLSHLRESHDGMTKEVYKDKFGDYWKPEEHIYHFCKPCGGKRISLIHDRLLWHATNIHKMSLKKYFHEFVMLKTFRLNY